MITSVEALRALYPVPKERTLIKELDYLDPHSIRFVSHSPFLVLGTRGSSGAVDASPRGGNPGFAKVADQKHIMIPDAPGNNRLDSLSNIVETGNVGILFLIPGVDETLRVNGTAGLRDEKEFLEHFTGETRKPKVVIHVEVQELYIHCAKALMRSKLWDPESQIDREELPTIGQMINDQIGSSEPPETREEMLKRYAKDL